jgi:ABC-type branched-subunit amino acid transport system ATPase component
MAREESIVLVVNNLKKSFGAKDVLDGFSYSFEEKKIYALMGANGSGKTTLFNLISGFLKVDSGEILFKNRPINNLLPYQIANFGICRTFQDMRLIPSLSVQENIILAFKNKPSEKLLNAFVPRESKVYVEKAKNILTKTHLYNVKGSKAKDISYGQQKLLNLAVAMANDFDLLLLDEPVAGVQPKYREDILELIKSFEKTVIVIEHNPEFIEALTKNILFLDGGKIIASGDYKTIKANKQVQKAYL